MMLAFYLVMAGLTALEFYLRLKPRLASDWIGLAMIAALWPIAVGFAAYYAFRKYVA